MPELNYTILKNSTNLKAYYRFESGAELVDSSGTGNTLSAIGAPTYSAGKFGQGVDLASASSQAFSITDTATLKPTGSYSIVGWIKTSTKAASQGIMASYSNITNKISGIIMYLNTSGHVVMLSGKNTGIAEGTDYKSIETSADITDGTYKLVVGTWDGANLRIYVNSKCEVTVAWANAPVYGTVYQRVGCFSDSGTNTGYFNGSLDDVFLLNGTALTADQIKELYEGRTLGELFPQAGLVAGYHLNGHSTDFSGNNRHGTDTGITYGLANGKFNQGALFGGDGDKITVATTTALDFEHSDHTIAMWINEAAFSASTTHLIGKGQRTASKTQWVVRVTNAGIIQALISYNNDSAYDIASSTNAIATNTWYYVVITYVTATRTYQIYINGKQDAGATTSVSTIATAANTDPMLIGIDSTSTAGLSWNGKMDEIQLFNVAKDANWVRKQYAWSVGKFL